MSLHIQLAKIRYWTIFDSRWVSSFFPTDVCSSSFMRLPLTWLSVFLNGLWVFALMFMNSRATSCLFSLRRSEVVVDCFLDCVFEVRFSAVEEERGSKSVAMIEAHSNSYCIWDGGSSHLNSSSCREACCDWRCVNTCENAVLADLDDGQSRAAYASSQLANAGKIHQKSWTFNFRHHLKSKFSPYAHKHV